MRPDEPRGDERRLSDSPPDQITLEDGPTRVMSENRSRPDHRAWRRGPWGKPPWASSDGPPWRTMPRGHPMRRVFMRRFLFVIALALLLVGGWVAGLALLFTHLLGSNGAVTWLVWAGGVGLVLALPLFAMAMAGRVFRSYALPLADIMDAANAVAAGDFSTRVKTRGAPDFQRLATSFNEMTEELARSDQQRRNLTADVAHELRTPLHIIRGNLEGVLDGVYEPTPAHIEATLQETRTLARLVDDLRTLSLAEAGELPLAFEAVDVADLLADVVTSYEVQAEAAGITLHIQVDDDVPPTLEADAGRLDQVLSNLVANALRHTPAGGQVRLEAAVEASAQRAELLLTVVDTGEGIPAADLAFVFDRFWRGDRARSQREQQGGVNSGLGLAIAAQLVAAHGGTIEVQSEVGRGTSFTVRLPLAA